MTAAARSSTRISVDGVLGRFHDVAYAYRFGAPGHDLVVATLDVSGQRVADAFHFPIGLPSTRSDDLGFTASAIRVAGNIVAITVRADRFAQYVALETGAFVPDDNYFHLEPGAERVVLARAAGAGTSPRFDGIAHALNAHEGVRIAMATDAASVTAITDPRTANAIGRSRT